MFVAVTVEGFKDDIWDWEESSEFLQIAEHVPYWYSAQFAIFW